jgi:hypothetical protein
VAGRRRGQRTGKEAGGRRARAGGGPPGRFSPAVGEKNGRSCARAELPGRESRQSWPTGEEEPVGAGGVTMGERGRWGNEGEKEMGVKVWGVHGVSYSVCGMSSAWASCEKLDLSFATQPG